MKRVIVIGCPGSGKSVFSRKLHRITGLPLCHLDQLYWNPDGTVAEKAVFQGRLTSVLEKERWIMDGNYASTMQLRMQYCDTVIFLDYPLDTCLAGIRERRGKMRPDIPWIEPENEVDEAFVAFVKVYPREGRERVLELLTQYPQKKVLTFASRQEASDYLEQLMIK